MKTNESNNLEGIAIVGMSGRFPGARNVAEFWENQKARRETISHFQESDVPGQARQPNYVGARSMLADVDQFDPAFFGILPKEAELMDPQHRIFLECCWEALEDAGYDPFSYSGAIGVYAGCTASTYFLNNVCATREFIEAYTAGYQVDGYAAMMGANPDFVATRVAYKLNLKGPAFSLQAGCSTSLIAICQACQSLLTYQSDMALAGGISITFPQKRGYLYQEGGMVSADGHCRAFDEKAAGTVFGSGAGVVLLKRYEDALADGDHVYAVIRGFGLNNDGSSKVGYTAPSVEGQARVVAMAQAAAGVHPESIGYIEAHGTGTPLGDPIEVAGLTQAFRARTQARNFCAIGTAKANVGHLDNAAGVTGLIHAVQMLRNKILIPTLHFQKPNPKLNLEDSPFYVNTEVREWKSDGKPRRAGVSAMGVGGTNAHVILEEAPERESTTSRMPAHLLVLSAKSETALEAATTNLAAYLKANPDANLADVAHTLQQGRRHFQQRRAVAAQNVDDAVTALTSRDARRVITRSRQLQNPKVAFMFPGQGSQYPNMGSELYQTLPVFREQVDGCAEILRTHLGFDLREVLYPKTVSDDVRQRLTETGAAQPAIFTIEYALAKLWMSWGIEPQAMIGHSIGEFVAACLADVFSLEEALALVAARGRMMQRLPAGAMLSVRLPEAEIRARLNGQLALAASNGPALSVVSGPFDAVEKLEKELDQQGVMFRRLVTSHAFHSAMMNPIVEPFTDQVKKVRLRAPKLPYVSTVTAAWITAEEATNPAYWGSHLRHPVLFSRSIVELGKTSDLILLEVGAGNILTTLARQHTKELGERVMVPSLPDASGTQSDWATMLSAVGSLWSAGVQINWPKLYEGEQHQRVSLPTYAFDRKSYWIEAPRADYRPPASEQLTPSTEVPLDNNERPNGESTLMALPTTAPALDRCTRIRTMLAEIFEELSGNDLSNADHSASFLDLGFDSLFLTQVTQAIQSKFGLKITFRQLLDQQSTLEALAAFVDSKLPSDALPAEAPVATAQNVQKPAAAVATAVPTAVQQSATLAPSNGHAAQAAPVDATTAERIIQQQLQAMSQLMVQQLEMLRGTRSAPVLAQPSSVSQPAATDAMPSVPQSALASVSSSTTTATEFGKPEFKPFGPYKPIQKAPAGGLTPQQERYIAALIEKYTRRTAGSKQFTQQHRRELADPRVVSGFRAQWKELIYPIVTVRSKGSRMWDVDGNEYIDILNGFGPIMLGHRPDFVEKAIEKQLHEGFEIGPQTPLAGEVAQMFCEMTGNERMTFCNTGSEAVMAALRVARTVTGRMKVVLFVGAYHGMFDEVLVKGLKTKSGLRSLPIAPGIPQEKVDNIVVLDYGTPEALEYIKAHAKELAAVLVEPVQSRHPALQPVEFLKEIRKITQQSETALIFDEVVTGFRVAPGGCQALFGIRADLATYGKVVAGGMPIGVLAGKAAFMDALDGGSWQFGDASTPEVGVTFFAGTFVRHPLTLAAVKAVLQHFKEEGPDLQRQLNEKTNLMVSTLNAFFDEAGAPLHIEHFGSIFYFGFPSDQRFGSLFYYHLREKGIHIQEGFPCFLTTQHSHADIEHIVRAFKESIHEMQDGGVLPGPDQQIPTAATTPPKEKSDGHGTLLYTSSQAKVAAASPEAPLTESQLEIFLSAQLSKEASCSYNESISLHLQGELHEAALREALRRLVQRHEALRASFSPNGDFQRFAPSLSVDLPVLDLTGLDETSRKQRMEKILADDARLPFDLIAGPLVRMKLLKLGPQNHTLLFTSHHIVCDGWSINVILDELSKLYSALRDGKPCDLPTPMPFGTYARSQAKHFESSEGKEIENFWVTQFKKLPPPLDLPLDRARPAVKGFAGATCRRRIGADVYRNLKKAGAQQKCTLFVTLLAGLQALLSRLSGQDDIVVGIPAAGQSLLEDQTLVGHCVNFLPLRGRFADDLKMSEYLGQVKRTLLDAYDHQNYTYGRLVRKLAITRDPSRLPLVEIQFNLERVGTGMEFSGLKVDVDSNSKAFVNHDMFLNVVESDDGLVLDCDYNTRLFDRETIDRWLGHYQTLLESLVADATQPVAKLPLLSQAELQGITVGWNNTHSEYPRTKCIHQLFEEQAAKTPDAVAVVFEDRRLTYAELNTRANQLAGYLAKRGVKPGVRVGLLVERSLEMMVGLLGILKAGGAYVPIDPTYPKDRISFVLEDANVGVLLTQEKLAKNLKRSGTELVCLDTGWNAIAREHGAALQSASAEDLAYVIYTSGSTGKPKGVEISHRAAVNLLCSMKKKPGLAASDTLLAVTTLSFDIAALELYLPLSVGAKLVIASRETAADGNLLLEKLRSSGATVIQATPATFRLLLEAGWNGKPALKILCGGEALPRELANQLLERTKFLWNMYGPTETTIWSSTIQVQPGDGPVPVGPPIDNTQFYVLDTRGQVTSFGVAGELHIGGDGLARGYFNRPELTAEKFIPDPFSNNPSARLYKTGDLVRRRADGYIEFLGRMDNQVKLRGYRIELGEIETAVARYPGVREVAVIVREDNPGDKRLVAYLVTGQKPPAVGELRDFLSEKLPTYMLPSAVVSMEAMPLTPNGKVDRRALLAFGMGQAAAEKDFVAPRTAQEQALADIWANVLRVERVSIQDSLFDLGADSIHVFQITARANAAGLKFTPIQLLEHPRISSLVLALGGEVEGEDDEDAPIRRVSRVTQRLKVKTNEF